MQSIKLWQLADNLAAIIKDADTRGWTAEDARHVRLLGRFIQSCKTKCPIDDAGKWYRLRRFLESNRPALQDYYRNGVQPLRDRYDESKDPPVYVARELMMAKIADAIQDGFTEERLHAIAFFASIQRMYMAAEQNTAEVPEP